MKNDISGIQIRAARALLDWSREKLAEASQTTERTIARVEAGDVSPRGMTIDSVRDALSLAGVEFIPGNGKGPGVRLLPQVNGWILDLAGRRVSNGQAEAKLYFYPEEGRCHVSSVRALTVEGQGHEFEFALAAETALSRHYSEHPELVRPDLV